MGAAVAITFFVTLIVTVAVASIIVVAIFLYFRKTSAPKSTSSKSTAVQSTSSTSTPSNGKRKPPPPPRPVARAPQYPSKDGQQQIRNFYCTHTLLLKVKGLRKRVGQGLFAHCIISVVHNVAIIIIICSPIHNLSMQHLTKITTVIGSVLLL